MLFCFLKSGYQNNYGAYGQSNTYKQNWNNDSDSESNIIIHQYTYVKNY